MNHSAEVELLCVNGILQTSMATCDFREDDEDFQRTAISALVVAHGILEAQRLRAERRSHNRHYLTRPELLPNPRLDTPWQQLYNSRCSRAYITTMGFDIEAFDF